MEKKTLFRDRQELQGTDFSSLQEFVDEAQLHLVLDAVASGKYFIGLEASQIANTEVSVGPGRLYKNGFVYALEQNESLNLLAYLPPANARIVYLTCYGTTIEIETEPRDFLIDIDTGDTEPSPVPMLSITHISMAHSPTENLFPGHGDEQNLARE